MSALIHDVDAVLTTTRAVRYRMDFDRPVESEVIEECLALAQQATMGSNQEDWRFVAVTEPTRKLAIAELYRDIWVQTVERPLADRKAQLWRGSTLPSGPTDRRKIVNGECWPASSTWPTTWSACPC